MTDTKKTQAIIYARLACQDKWTDTRLGDQVGALENLANEHGLTENNVITEIGSGSSLKQRPGLRTMLDQAKNGEVTHVIVADFACLLRTDKRTDWRHIARAFAAGNVTLIAGDTVFDFGMPGAVDLFLNFGFALKAARG